MHNASCTLDADMVAGSAGQTKAGKLQVCPPAGCAASSAAGSSAFTSASSNSLSHSSSSIPFLPFFPIWFQFTRTGGKGGADSSKQEGNRALQPSQLL